MLVHCSFEENNNKCFVPRYYQADPVSESCCGLFFFSQLCYIWHKLCCFLRLSFIHFKITWSSQTGIHLLHCVFLDLLSWPNIFHIIFDTIWKANPMEMLHAVYAMDYLITIKPLYQTKHLSENKPLSPGITRLSIPTLPGHKCHDTLSFEQHTAHCPIMSWTLHNNLELNFVCEAKQNAAVYTILNNKKHDHRNSPFNHRDQDKTTYT